MRGWGQNEPDSQKMTKHYKLYPEENIQKTSKQ